MGIVVGNSVRELEGVEVGRFDGEEVRTEVVTDVGQEEGGIEGLLVIGHLEGNPVATTEGNADGTEEK